METNQPCCPGCYAKTAGTCAIHCSRAVTSIGECRPVANNVMMTRGCFAEQPLSFAACTIQRFGEVLLQNGPKAHSRTLPAQNRCLPMSFECRQCVRDRTWGAGRIQSVRK